jgi:hypothetical protein
MKNKTKVILTAMAASLMIAGCGTDELPSVVENEPIAEQTTGKTEEKTETVEKEEKTEKPSDTETEKKEETEKQEAEKTAGDELVEAFLAGTASATVKESYLTTLAYVDGTLEAGASYTLEQLEEALKNNEEYEETVDCTFAGHNYQKLDVSRAAGEWYCIAMDPLEGGSYQVGTVYFIVQALDGELQIAMSTEEYYRTYATITKAGVAYYGGSSGAGDQSVDCYVIDGAGDAQNLYRSETVWYGWSLYEGFEEREDLTAAFDSAATALGEAGLDINEVTLTQEQYDGIYYYYLESESEAALLAAREAFEAAGVTLDDPEAVKVERLAKAQAFGMKAENLEAEILVW